MWPQLSIEKSELIVETPHGATIQRTGDSYFLVCDGENHCRSIRSLYSAEQELDALETGFLFPYSTSFVRLEGSSHSIPTLLFSLSNFWQNRRSNNSCQRLTDDTLDSFMKLTINRRNIIVRRKCDAVVAQRIVAYIQRRIEEDDWLPFQSKKRSTRVMEKLGGIRP